MRFTLFDRWGTQIGAINDVISAIHKDELNGEDSLTLTLASCNLVKGNRIVWRDKFGVWHEHIVNDLKDVHEDGRMYTVAYCENSLAELFTDYIEELRPYNVTATVALQRALSATRWQIGTVSIQGNGSASFYHISVREALSLITENWGGELSATIAISGTHVQSRSVNITSRGSDNGKRFEWSKDLRGITREVSTDDVCTALYGYGKGLEAYDDDGNPTGGFERKLTFGEINNNLDYVADEDARLVWGLPDGNGGKKHTFGKVEFPDCEDMGELKNLTTAELQRRKQPQVSYSASVIDLADAGYEFEDVRTGDTVAIIDRELGERLSGRVLCVERDLFNESATVITLGNIVRTIHDVISNQLSTLYNLRDHSAAWDGAASISESYINGVINVWNDTMNATGGYSYNIPGEGFITYDRPEDSNPTMAIQLKGAGFRIANSKLSNGDWDWRTFGTGDGFTADCLNVGTIRGGSNYWNLETGNLSFEQGMISTSDGSSYWNMTTGEVHLATSATLGNKTVSGLLSDVSTVAADLAVTAEQFSVDMTALTTRVGTNETDIAALKLSAQQFSVDISNSSTAITQIKATYGTCSTAGGTAEKAVTCSNFALRAGAVVTVKFTYKNTSANPTLNVNSTGEKAIYLNGSAIPEAAYWGAGETMSFIYDGTNWVVTDGAATAQIVTNSSDIASLKLSAQQFSVDISSHTESITQLKATYCTCSTAAATQAKEATCADFALRTGAIIAVKFTYANTVANPTLNVNSTGAKAIYLNGSAIPEANWWKAGDVVTLVYNGTYWYVADGATLTQLASTNTNVANLTLRADAFDVTVAGIKATYGSSSTAADTQTKESTIANFAAYVGQTVVIRFTYANSTSYPKLKVQNGDGSVSATGYIMINGSYLGEYYWWKAGETITFVWDGTYWRIADGGTMSRIKVLEDSIDLTVTNGSLGSSASIKLSVGGTDVATETVDLTGVRSAFASESSQITISAGKVTFNSGTFVVNSTHFSVTSAGVITATSGTIGGFTIGSSSIYNSKMTLDSTGLTLKMDSTTVGNIGTNSLLANASAKGLVFDLEYAGYYMAWSVKETSNASYYSIMLAYANRSLAMQSGSAWTSGRLHVACPLDLHDYKAYNFWIDPNTGGANGGITTTINWVRITSMSSDGTASYWYNSNQLVFKNGLLIGATV